MTVTALTDFTQRLDKTAEDTEALLGQLLSDAAMPDEIARPKRLIDAMRYSSLGGGKRLRPFLVVESAAVFGVSPKGALLAGAALECIHCYSLIHDDLPAMDNSDLRRGRPTLHKVYDDATAILAGDALLTIAFDIITRDEIHPDAGVRLALTRALARCAGIGTGPGTGPWTGTSFHRPIATAVPDQPRQFAAQPGGGRPRVGGQGQVATGVKRRFGRDEMLARRRALRSAKRL